jgi:putative membrane protein
MTIQDIPTLNASLNGLATVLITIGFVLIKTAQKQTDPIRRVALIGTHRRVMTFAMIVSAIFLVGYVTHKILIHGVHTPFGGVGAIRKVYYAMLISHILLAMSIAYLVPRTFLFAIRGDFTRHRAWARWTFPIWYYVSITGVLVYFFLYQWWPAAKVVSTP